MFNICVCKEAQFYSKKLDSLISTLPIVVEFEKLASKYLSADESDNNQECCSAMCLLHSVALLYYKTNNNLKHIYKQLCSKDTQTILVLRDAQEIINDWKQKHKKSQQLNKTATNELLANYLDTTVKASKSSSEISTTTSGIFSDAEEESISSSSFKTNTNRDSLSSSWENFDSNIKEYMSSNKLKTHLSSIYKSDDEDEINKCEEKSETYDSMNLMISQIISDLKGFIHDLDQNNKLTDSLDDIQPHQVHIIHRLIAAVTFTKDLRSGINQIIKIEQLFVRKSYRNCGIGSYLIQLIKSSNLSGNYYLLTVDPTPSTFSFFTKHLFQSSPVSSSLNYYPPLRLGDIEEGLEYWRISLADNVTSSMNLIYRMKKEIDNLKKKCRTQQEKLRILEDDNRKLRTLLDSSHILNALSAIDDIGSLFESVKELCRFLK